MFIYGFLYENVCCDLIFKLRLKSRRKGWISTHTHTRWNTLVELCLKHYIKIGLKSWNDWCSRSELDRCTASLVVGVVYSVKLLKLMIKFKLIIFSDIK
jgi:hypothetical protein